MMEPKVTIIGSCYNHEKFVGEAIESVLKQTYKNWELFLVNDGSTDKTAEIISSYLDDDRISFVDLKENTSAAGAYAILHDFVEKTDSVYVASFSSDDMWRTDKLEKQIQFLENNKSYKACFTWDTIIYEENRIGAGVKDGYSHRENDSRYGWLYHFLKYGNCLNSVSSVIDRNVYIEIGGYNWVYRNLQDFDLWIKLVMKYPFYLYPECLTYYRRHATNISNPATTFYRAHNELFYIHLEVIRKISDEDFKITFFKDFVYAESSTHEEILAEKVAFMLNSYLKYRQQVAFCLIMENSQNKEFMKILETKYDLTMGKIHELTGKTGLMFIQDQGDRKFLYHKENSDVLMAHMGKQGFGFNDLKQIKYRSLYRMREMLCNSKDGMEHFNKIIGYLYEIQEQNQTEDFRCLFVVGEDAVKEFVEKQMTANTDYIAVLPKKENMYIDDAYCEENQIITGIRKIIFDKKEHRICYLWEKDDTIWNYIFFYGCLNQKYPVLELIESITLQSMLYRLPSTEAEEDSISWLLRDFE